MDCTVLLCRTESLSWTAVAVYFLFGKRKFVMLRSALEDFEDSTLSAVPGLLGKLRYVALLHSGGGGCLHWGVGKICMEGTAREGIRTLPRGLGCWERGKHVEDSAGRPRCVGAWAHIEVR